MTTDPVRDLTEALRLTVEYVGTDTLPPLQGWSWYDAMVRHDPESAARFRAEYLSRHPDHPGRVRDPNEIGHADPVEPGAPCHWTHAHGPHEWLPLVEDPDNPRVLHTPAVIRCPGKDNRV